MRRRTASPTGIPSGWVKQDLRLNEVLHFRERDEWFIVTGESTSWPIGVCLVSKQPERVGESYGMTTDMLRVPEAEVPSKVWVQLALWRLT